MNFLQAEWGEKMGIEFKDEYLEKIVEADTRSRENSLKIEEVKISVKGLEEQNHTLIAIAESVKTLGEGIGSVKGDVKEIKKDQADMKEEIREIKNNPEKTKAKWFDRIGKTIVTAIVSGIAAFILGQLCPSIFGG